MIMAAWNTQMTIQAIIIHACMYAHNYSIYIQISEMQPVQSVVAALR